MDDVKVEVEMDEAQNDWKTYVGCTVLGATPTISHDGRPGYSICCGDGRVYWKPAEDFEAAYMEIGDDARITQTMVEDFVAEWDEVNLGEKTTVVCATLANGFEIVESSSCVDPDNYDDEIGVRLCRARIYDRIWEMLGFMLQQAASGLEDGVRAARRMNDDEAADAMAAGQAADPTADY